MGRAISMLAVLAVVVAACGDGGGSEAATTGALAPASTSEGSSTAGTVPGNATPAPAPVTTADGGGTSGSVGGEETPVTSAAASTAGDAGDLSVVPGGVAPVPPPAGVIDSVPGVDTAVADLARRLGIASADITVVSAEFVVWPDGGLGCPRPGMQYLQVPVDGMRVVLWHAGLSYSYHGGGATPLFLCEAPAKAIPGGVPGSGGDS